MSGIGDGEGRFNPSSASKALTMSAVLAVMWNRVVEVIEGLGKSPKVAKGLYAG